MSVDVRGPDGKITRFPDGTDDATINRVMASVYAKKAAPKQKSVARELWDGTVNKVAGMVQGRASVVDMLAQGTGKLMAATTKPLEYAADAVGAEKLASGVRYVNNALANPPTIGGAVEAIAPTPQDTLGKADRIAAQLVGSLGTGREINALLSAPKVNLLPTNVPKGFRAPPKPGRNVPEAREIVAVGAREKVPVMTSDVRPPRTFMGQNVRSTGEKIPFAGTGGKRAAQQTARVEAVKNVLRDYGGDDTIKLFDDAPTAVDAVAKDLLAKRGKELGRFTAQKKGVIARLAKNERAVPVDITTTHIDDIITKLKGRNNTELNPLIAKLENYKTAFQNKSLAGIEDERALLGEAYKSPELAAVSKQADKIIRSLYAPLREDMGRFIRVHGAQGDYTKWKAANDRLAAMSGELENAAFKRVLRTSEMTPENVSSLIFSKNPSDVRRLVAGLSPSGQARAKTAVLQRAFDKAISADGGLSVERFVNNLDTLGSPIGVMFKGADRTRIEGLAKLLDATRRASAASAMPPTGVQNAPAVAGYTLGTLFGQAAIPIAAAGGFLARAYESAPVRNLLLGLGNAKPGSAAEAALLNRAAQAVAKVVAANVARTPSTAVNDVLPAIGRVAAESPDERPDDANQ